MTNSTNDETQQRILRDIDREENDCVRQRKKRCFQKSFTNE